MNNHRSELTKVVIHRAPIRIMMFMGGERNLVITSAMFCGYMIYLLSFRYNIFIGFGVGLSLWTVLLYVLRRMAQADPQMWQVFNRHIKYKAFYPARGRFDALQPIIRDFK